MAGLLIDLTELRLTAVRAATEHAVAEALRHRAVIGQAKGIVMVVHRVNADTACHLLSRHSQNTNTKLHELAAHLVNEIADPSFDPVPADIDALLKPPDPAVTVLIGALALAPDTTAGQTGASFAG